MASNTRGTPGRAGAGASVVLLRLGCLPVEAPLEAS